VLPERAQELRDPSEGWTLLGFSAAVFALFLAWSEGQRHSSREQFVHHCAALTVDYLRLDIQLPPVPRRTGGRR